MVKRPGVIQIIYICTYYIYSNVLQITVTYYNTVTYNTVTYSYIGPTLQKATDKTDEAYKGKKHSQTSSKTPKPQPKTPKTQKQPTHLSDQSQPLGAPLPALLSRGPSLQLHDAADRAGPFSCRGGGGKAGFQGTADEGEIKTLEGRGG